MFYVLSTFHIYQNQEASTILRTLLKRAEVIPITELFISSKNTNNFPVAQLSIDCYYDWPQQYI